MRNQASTQVGIKSKLLTTLIVILVALFASSIHLFGRRTSVVGLNLFPYILSVLILFLFSRFMGNKKMLSQFNFNRFVPLLTILIACIDAYYSLHTTVSLFTLTGLSIWFTHIAGVFVLLWLANIVTSRGLGNGVSLLLFLFIVTSASKFVVQSSFGLLPSLALFSACIISLFSGVALSRSTLKILVKYHRRQQGKKMFAGQSSHVPLLLCASGALPTIFLYTLLHYAHHLPSSLVPLLFVATFFVAFLVTPPLNDAHFNSKQISDSLRQNGGLIIGVRSGLKTQEFFCAKQRLVSFVTAFFYSTFCVVSVLLIKINTSVFGLALTPIALYIVLAVVLDLVKEVQEDLMPAHYQELLRKSRQ